MNFSRRQMIARTSATALSLALPANTWAQSTLVGGGGGVRRDALIERPLQL